MAKKFSIKLDNEKEVKAMLRNLPGNMKMQAARVLYQWGETVMTLSKQIVPVDTGTLMGTGKVIPPSLKTQTLKLQLGYGGPSVKYARIVHENLQGHEFRGGRQAKYLSTPMQTMWPILRKDLEAILAASMKGSK